MNVISEAKDAIAVLKMDHGKMMEISGRKDSTMWGIVILAVPPVVNAVLAWLRVPSGGGIFSSYMFWPVFIPVLSYTATIFLMSLLAEKVFHGVKDHIGFFRIMSYVLIVLWITMVPFLFGIFGIMADPYRFFKLIYLVCGAWMFYVSFYVLMFHNKLTKDNALLTVIFGIIIAIIVSSILGDRLIGVSYSWY